MVEPLLKIFGLRKSFGALTVSDGVDLIVQPGELHALIGPNGAGKTSLINLVCGALKPDAGSVEFSGQNISGFTVAARARLGMARSFQITSILPEFSVLENVAISAQAINGSSFRFWANASSQISVNEAALACLAEVGLEERAHIRAGEISHGEKRSLEVAMALALKPKLLLLDEPMAGMGHDESVRLTKLLRHLKGRYGILLVEHDMAAVFALADRISVLVYGRVIASDTPDAIRTNPEVRQAYLGDEEFAGC